MAHFTLYSSAFAQNTFMPARFTCDGVNVNPQLTIEGTPENAQSLALIMEDKDLPQEIKSQQGIEVFDHWVLFNIPPKTTTIDEAQKIGIPGMNSMKEQKYFGPCPPTQYQPTEHRYTFTLFALDGELTLEAGATKAQVLAAMEGHILAQTELVGRCDRSLTNI